MTDEFNGTFQKELQISIADASIPIIETTLSMEVANDGSVQVGLSLTDAGGGADLLEWGVLISTDSLDDSSSEGVQQMRLSYDSGHGCINRLSSGQHLECCACSSLRDK